MTEEETTKILLYNFGEELVRKMVDAIAKEEREACAERAWTALVKHGQPWNVRQDVTDAIKARGQE